ncbi:MFS transporter [Gottfriedia acidiceleris]|uniref:MFS transporter n=1 Tax=Gottfriedia acidiceleris TaxID=371036 RepID=UPI002F26DD78
MSRLEIFRNKNYILLFFANLTSQMGSVIGITAITYYMLNRFSNQPAYTTTTELMYSLPTLIVFFIVGVLADTLDRKKIALYSDLICGILSLFLFFSFMKGLIPLIFLFLFLRSAISKFFQPAQQALIQGVLREEEYTVAAGLNQMVSSLFLLFGSGLGIFVFLHLGVKWAIAIDGFSFIISGILINFCRIKESVRLPNGSKRLSDIKFVTILKDFSDGFSYIKTDKLRTSLTIGFFVFGFVNGGLSVMPAFIMKYKLTPNTYETSMIWFGIVFGTAMLLGSIVASLIAPKFKLYQLIIGGLFITGLFIGLSSLATNVYLFLVFNFVVGLFLPIANVGIGGWLPRIIDPKMMGRVQGCINPLIMVAQSIALGLITITFPKYVSIESLFVITGAGIFMVSIYFLRSLPYFSQEEHVLSKESSVDL